MDGGVIVKIKAILRKHYSKWAVKLTVDHLQAGGEPSEVKVPSDVPTCKTNLVEWLSAAYTEINESSQSVVVKAWEDTKLSMAWDRTVQGEALAKQHSLQAD